MQMFDSQKHRPVSEASGWRHDVAVCQTFLRASLGDSRLHRAQDVGPLVQEEGIMEKCAPGKAVFVGERGLGTSGLCFDLGGRSMVKRGCSRAVSRNGVQGRKCTEGGRQIHSPLRLANHGWQTDDIRRPKRILPHLKRYEQSIFTAPGQSHTQPSHAISHDSAPPCLCIALLNGNLRRFMLEQPFQSTPQTSTPCLTNRARQIDGPLFAAKFAMS